MIYSAYPLAQFNTYREEILSAITRVLDSGRYVLGPEVSLFEDRLATYCGAQHAIGTNSGTDALILSLRALGIGPGDEVITVSLTAIATVSAVIACGATPVLVDVDPELYTIDPDAVARAVTDKTKAVIPVHLYGQSADMNAIMEIAKQHDLFVIEDCAQAAGASYFDQKLGSIGDVGCFSFYPTKNLGAIGDGGAVVTKNETLKNRILRQRQYGWDNSRVTTEPGLNSRLDEIQAAILNVKLQYLDADNERRRNLAAQYDKKLPRGNLITPKVRSNAVHIYHLYVITTPLRDRLLTSLRNSGVGAEIHYASAAHQHGGYDRLCLIPENGLPVTERLVSNILTLPIYPELTSVEIDKIISFIK